MCERGTEVAVFDYADAGERHLGITAFVLYPFPPRFSSMLHRFARRFGDRCIGLSFDEVRAARRPEDQSADGASHSRV